MTPRVATRRRAGFDRTTDGLAERKCASCDNWRPLDSFGKAPACRLGRNYRCAECKNRQRNRARLLRSA